ncbi:TRAP transporter small permease [Caminibacter sp.]
MRFLEKAVEVISVFMTSFGIAAGVLLAFINVVARFVFHEGLDWAFELTSYLFIWSAFFGAAYLFKTGGHIKVTLLLDIVPPVFAKILAIIADLSVILYLLAVAYYGYVYIFDPDLGVKASGEISVDLNIPIWYVYTVLPISMICAAILTFYKTYRDIKTPKEEISSKTESEMIIEEVKENLGDNI